MKLGERVAPILTLDVEPLCRSSISWSKYCGISIPRRAFQRASRSTESKAAFRSTKATCRGWLNSRWTSDNSWWRSMHAISSYRGNRPTNTQTHKQTNRQGLLGAYNTLRRYSAKLSAQCIIQNECYLEFAGIAYITNCISKVYSIWMLTVAPLPKVFHLIGLGLLTTVADDSISEIRQ